MRPALRILLLAVPVLLGPVLAAAPDSPEARLSAWAGPDAGPLNLTVDRMTHFLQAWAVDPKQGATAEWRPWLEGMLKAKSLRVRVWAMARLLEAGFPERGGDWIDAVHMHRRATTEYQSGYSNRALVPPPALPGVNMPPAWLLLPETPFLAGCFKELQAKPQKFLTEERYDALAYNLRPCHRDTLLAIAGASEAPPVLDMLHTRINTSDQVARDPYKDRVWRLVHDWLTAWGSASDFDAFRAAQPRNIFIEKEAQILEDELRAVPAFWASVEWADTHRGSEKFGPAPSGTPSFAKLDAIPVAPERARSRRNGCDLLMRVGFDGDGTIQHLRPLPAPWLCLFGPPMLRAAAQWSITGGASGTEEQEIVEPIALEVRP